MTGITKLEAHLLAGNEFKLKDKEGKEWDMVRVSPDWIDVSRFEGGVYEQVVFYSQIGTDYHIICHSLDKLTQPIMHKGKECVPIVELSKKMWSEDLEVFDVGRTMDYFYCESKTQISKKRNLIIDEDGFHHSLVGYVEPRLNGIRKCYNQPALFAYMDSLHFDRFGWSERGLTTPK